MSTDGLTERQGEANRRALKLLVGKGMQESGNLGRAKYFGRKNYFFKNVLPNSDSQYAITGEPNRNVARVTVLFKTD
jgi:hypothetical protein